MLLVALLGVSQGVWAHDWAIYGTWNNTNNSFTDGTNQYSVNLSANTTYTFHLYRFSDGFWFGNNGTIAGTKSNCDWEYQSNGNQTSLETKAAGTYTFTICKWVNGNPYLNVTFPEPQISCDVDSWTEHSISSSYTYNFTTTGTKSFVIKNADGTYYKAQDFTRCENSKTLTTTSTDATVDVDVTGNYKFTWNSSTHLLTIDYPTDACHPDCSTMEDIVKGINVMFYFETYGWGDNKTGITKGNSTLIGTSKLIGSSASPSHGYVTMPYGSVPSTVYVTNNSSGNWGGRECATGQTGANAAGAYYLGGRDPGSKTDATTISVNPSATSIGVGTSSITLTSKASATTAAYNNGTLYSMVYICNSDKSVCTKVDGSCQAVSTSNYNYTLSTSSLAAGTYKIVTILTDGTVHYIGNEFTLTVTSCTAPDAKSVYIGGSSLTSQTICSTSNTCVRLAASQSGYTYQLKRYNTSTSAWNDIGDAWSSNGTVSHDFTDLSTAGTYKITGYPTGSSSSCNQDMSNTVTLYVDNESVAGNITGAGSICSGESKTLGVSGNTGTVTQWSSSSTSGGTYNPIESATASTYSASPASTTYYKVVVKNGVCDAVTSSSYATVTVNPAATAADYPIKSGTDTKSYTGSPQEVTIEPVSGTGTYTVYYTGTEGTSYTKSSTAPTNVGKYSVTVDAQKGTSYCAANNLDVGTLTITAAAPTITMGAISNACGTGDYNISGLASSNSSGAITYSVVGGTGTANIDVTTLSVTAVGTVTIRASQAASGNYSAGSQDKTYTFASAPVAGFSASAVSSTLEFSNTAYVSTTLNTDANSEWDFQWICDSHPTWGTNNTPTIVSSTSNSTEVQFPIEGVYTFHVGAKCRKDNSYVSSNTVTVTVKLPLCIKGPLTNNTGSWNSYVLISNISNSNTRTYTFNAFDISGDYVRQFVLNASSSTSDDSHHIHNDYNYLTLENIEDSGHNNNLRATTALGITNSGTPVVLTITHNGGLYYNLSLALDCSTPEAKTISISASSVCEGESANVIVVSSQSGYIYTVYDSNSSVAGSGTGDGSNLNISVTPSSNTTYTVKAKQGSTCSETAMSNTVDVAVSPRPKYSPASGITQYLPVTVTSDATSPSWSFNRVSGSLDGAWISNTSGASTVFKAPTGSYTVSDGTCATGSITVSDDTETCD